MLKLGILLWGILLTKSLATNKELQKTFMLGENRLAKLRRCVSPRPIFTLNWTILIKCFRFFSWQHIQPPHPLHEKNLLVIAVGKYMRIIMSTGYLVLSWNCAIQKYSLCFECRQKVATSCIESQAVAYHYIFHLIVETISFKSSLLLASMLLPHQSPTLATRQHCNNHSDNLGHANLQTIPMHSVHIRQEKRRQSRQSLTMRCNSQAALFMQQDAQKLTETNSRLCMCRRHNRHTYLLHFVFLSPLASAFLFISFVSFPPFDLL